MKINLTLSPTGVANAIRKLEEVRQNLEEGVSDLVDILLTDGAMVANEQYGDMATAWGHKEEQTSGYIGVSGESEEAVYIAEFGAGDATLPVMFENYAGVDVYPGAYSEQKGTGEYAMTGKWHFGEQVFTEVKPRAGLLNAKYFIMDNVVDIAKEVIQLD